MIQHRCKTMMLLLSVSLVILLAGCGQTLDQKAAAVQEKNEITIQDVVDLMKLEGLDIQKQTSSTAFAAQWPDTIIYKVNGEHLLLLQSFEEELWKREKTLQEIGWDGHGYWGMEDAADVVKQAAADCQPETGQYFISKKYSGKNVVAWYVVYGASEQPDTEELETISATSELVEHVFRSDINGMQIKEFEKNGEQFNTNATMDYYRTPFTVGDATSYDFYMDVDFTIQLSDELLEKYQGQEILLSTEGPVGEGYFGSKRGSSSETTLVDAATSTLRCSLGKWQEIISMGYELPIQFQVTVSVGDFTETMLVDFAEESHDAENI